MPKNGISVDRFDLGYCRIADETTFGKKRSVAEMTRVCKPGGTGSLKPWMVNFLALPGRMPKYNTREQVVARLRAQV